MLGVFLHSLVLIVVFYSFTDAKTAVHEDIDGMLFLFSVTAMMKPAAQTWLPRPTGARSRTATGSGLRRRHEIDERPGSSFRSMAP